MADDSLQQRLETGVGFREPPIRQIVRPFQEFFQIEASSGIVLIAMTVIALLWANSPWAERYFQLWETEAGIVFGQFRLEMHLGHWINDGLMAIFFFLVGLEIKREILVGELSTPKKALLPIAAAVGGMIFPAVIYLAINAGTRGQAGWGIPMATDIAFALGVLALLGSRVPSSLKIFLAALAIVDDLGAVLVIAVFYTADLAASWLVVGATVFALMLLLNRLGVRHPAPYGLLGVVLWFAFLESGVHATIAGVLAAMAIPARSIIDVDQFTDWTGNVLHEFRTQAIDTDPLPGKQHITGQRGLLQALETAIHHAESPLQRLEHALELPVALVIMPIFALANAGVDFLGHFFDDLFNPVSLGIVFGLVVGKQIGILLFSFLAVRLRLAELPAGVTWRHIWGVAWLGGIGFTMALFIDGLAFGGSPLLDTAKIGILAASIISGIVGYAILRNTPMMVEEEPVVAG